MCIRVIKLWACGCDALNDDNTQESVLERCELACGITKGTKYRFGPNLCAVHETPFYKYLETKAVGQVAPNLTVGVEFEFLVAQQDGDTVLPEDDISPARWMVTKANKKSKWPSDDVKDYIVELLEGTVPIYSAKFVGRSVAWLKAKMAKFGITSLTEFPEYAMWQITQDSSLNSIPSEDPSGYNFKQTKMELVSRVLYEDNLGEVERVYRRMRESMRIHVNSSCGLHVHVGIPHLSLLEIKKLITLLVSLEPFLFHLVAPHRTENIYNCPLTVHSNAYADESDGYEYDGDEDVEPRARNEGNLEMNSWLPPTGLPSPTLRMFRRIWNSTTLDHIRNEMYVHDPSPREAMASCVLLRGDKSSEDSDGNRRSSDMTIEFRYREATGNPIVDSRWVMVCTAIVRCAQMPQTEFIQLIRTAEEANVKLGWEPSSRAFATLLGALGLEASVSFWQDTYRQYRDMLSNPPVPAILAPLPADSDEA